MRKWAILAAAGVMAAGSASGQVSPAPLASHEGGRFVTRINMAPIPGAKPKQMALYPGRSVTPASMVVTQTHQWPGVYSEAAFNGTGAVVRLDDSVNILHLIVDERPPIVLNKPGKTDYVVDGLAPGSHHIRLEKVTESQSQTAAFGGFYLLGAGREIPLEQRSRQIEFIGDSYTVGYGNTAGKQQCTEDEVWATTDTSQAFGPLTAKHYNADYQINAFSGRGVVRNYNGLHDSTLPEYYPYTLFDKSVTYAAPAWQPQIVVIALGTNDFSTPVHDGEKWKNKDELVADYEATYVGFVKSLRAKTPNAAFVLISYDTNTSPQISAVRDRLKADGDNHVDFLEVTGFSKNACHGHPDTSDDHKISDALVAFFDGHPGIWQGK